jgi:hypothetical protein
MRNPDEVAYTREGRKQNGKGLIDIFGVLVRDACGGELKKKLLSKQKTSQQ